MQDLDFEEYLRNRNLTEKTIQQRLYALKRIEKAYEINLDAEYINDRCASIIRDLSYSTNDERSNLPNPSKIDIDHDKLRTHLAWYKSHLVNYCRFKGDDDDIQINEDELDISPFPTENIVAEMVGKTFALERDLQAALRGNITDLEVGLQIIDGGSERKVEAGFIDILARDRLGVLTVIELKAEASKPEAIAQILAYMGCLTADTGEKVRGILVAGDHHSRVVLAAGAVPNLSLRKYRFQFAFD